MELFSIRIQRTFQLVSTPPEACSGWKVTDYNRYIVSVDRIPPVDKNAISPHSNQLIINQLIIIPMAGAQFVMGTLFDNPAFMQNDYLVSMTDGA